MKIKMLLLSLLLITNGYAVPFTTLSEVKTGNLPIYFVEFNEVIFETNALTITKDFSHDNYPTLVVSNRTFSTAKKYPTAADRDEVYNAFEKLLIN